MNNRLEIAREFANKIKSKYIKEIILFGSVARGDDNEDSDIDILVVSNHEDKIENDISNIVTEVGLTKYEILCPLIISEEDMEKTKDYLFIKNVLKEGIVL